MNEVDVSKFMNGALDGYERIKLEDLPAETMMERMDRKFLTSYSRIPDLLPGLQNHYNAIEAAGSVVAPYKTLYFDTEDFAFYRMHHRGFGNRVKVRYRHYPCTDTTFLEVKRKSNKGFTSKERIMTDGVRLNLDSESREFLNRQLPEIPASTLKSGARIEYTRLGFIAKGGNERFSVDFNMKAYFRDAEVSFGKLAIFEVKQDAMRTTPVVAHLRERGVREESVSKYCTALSLLNPLLRSNLFKPAIRRIQKIDNEAAYQ
ncbi:MAG: VTC domain-containing protein [Cryomorphaceae bacterium]